MSKNGDKQNVQEGNTNINFNDIIHMQYKMRISGLKNMVELERKFLVKKLPDLNNIKPINYERYFLSDDIEKQIRLQKKGDNCEIENKTKLNDKEYKKTKENISKERFIELSKECDRYIIRDSYLINEDPNVTIKIYKEKYEGLMRIEIEFNNIEEYNNFEIPEWLGNEITNTKIGLDAKLIKLDREEFLKVLEELS